MGNRVLILTRNKEDLPNVLTIGEVAYYLSLSRPSVIKLSSLRVTPGKFKCFRRTNIGGHRRYKKKDLLNFIKIKADLLKD